MVEFKDYEGQAKLLASRIFARSKRYPHISVLKEEVYSDICMIWMNCVKNFDPNAGASFKTYFSNSVDLSFRTIFKREHQRSSPMTSIDSMTHSDGDESYSAHDRSDWAIDETADTELEVIRREGVRKISEKYPVVAKMMELMILEPDDLIAELRAAQEQYEYAKAMGLNMNVPPTTLTFETLNQIFDFNWRDRATFHKEIALASRNLD